MHSPALVLSCRMGRVASPEEGVWPRVVELSCRTGRGFGHRVMELSCRMGEGSIPQAGGLARG